MRPGDEIVCCAQCCSEIDESDSFGLSMGDVCDSCYHELTTDCPICGEAMEKGTEEESPFLLIKAELAHCAGAWDRPMIPGIYREVSRPFLMSGMIGAPSVLRRAVSYVAPLPEMDGSYEISSQICASCAKAYEGMDHDREGELGRMRRAILEDAADLQSMELNPKEEDWQRWKVALDLPKGIRPYSEWLILDYMGVKLYSATGPGDLYRLVNCAHPEWRGRHHSAETLKSAGVCYMPDFSELPGYVPWTLEYRGYEGRDKGYKLLALRHAIRHGVIDADGVYHADKAKRMGKDWRFIGRQLGGQWKRNRAQTVSYLEYRHNPECWKRPEVCRKEAMGTIYGNAAARRRFRSGWMNNNERRS